MKKIILCIILVGVLFMLTSCSGNDTLLSVKTECHAMIIMPDGSLIQGVCTEFARYSDNYMYVKIDDIEYYLDTWRIVTWKK